MKKTVIFGRIMAAIFIGSWTTSVHAVAINISGTVIIAPCTINNSDIIEFDFGESVPVSDISDGILHADTQTYKVHCPGNPATSVNLKLTGTGISGKTGVIATSKPQLGIKLMAATGTNTATININGAVVSTKVDQDLTLTAILVEGATGELLEGEFTGTATLTAVIP